MKVTREEYDRQRNKLLAQEIEISELKASQGAAQGNKKPSAKRKASTRKR
jgi:hypothetical protein